MDGRTLCAWPARTPTILIQHELCHRAEMVYQWSTNDLLACDGDSSAETLGTWWQLAHPIFSRVLIAQHRR
jgi:hypothetical protein